MHCLECRTRTNSNTCICELSNTGYLQNTNLNSNICKLSIVVNTGYLQNTNLNSYICKLSSVVNTGYLCHFTNVRVCAENLNNKRVLTFVDVEWSQKYLIAPRAWHESVRFAKNRCHIWHSSCGNRDIGKLKSDEKCFLSF